MDEGIRERVIEAIEASGKTAYRMAKDTGISTAYFSRMMRDERGTFTVANVSKIARSTGFRAEYLAFGHLPKLQSDDAGMSLAERVSPIETAIAYLDKKLSVDAVATVRLWAKANPEEAAKLSAPDWGSRLTTAQIDLMGGITMAQPLRSPANKSTKSQLSESDA